MNFDELNKIVAESAGVSICEICGTPFTPYHSRQKTCGTEECKKQNKKEYMRTRFELADKETEERLRRSHAEANKKWREKKRRAKEREEQLDELHERWKKQADFDEYIRKHGHEYGKLQMQKTLALVPKIDVNIVGKRKEKENE